MKNVLFLSCIFQCFNSASREILKGDEEVGEGVVVGEGRRGVGWGVALLYNYTKTSVPTSFVLGVGHKGLLHGLGRQNPVLLLDDGGGGGGHDLGIITGKYR